MPKTSLQKDSDGIILPVAQKMRIHTFSPDISLKVNVIVRLEFDLASYDVAVQHVSHITNTPP